MTAIKATSVVLCVGLNPALDVTYHVDQLAHGQAQRVRSVTTRAGGKASNVCRVVATLGGVAHLVAPVGGTSGMEYVGLLAADHVPHTAVPVSGATRQTVAVVEDDGTTTLLSESGAAATESDWAAITSCVREALSAGVTTSGVTTSGVTTGSVEALVISGSVAPGLPDDAVAQLVRMGRAHGIPVLVDASGSQLTAALAAKPHVVKPNSEELLEVTGMSGSEGARRLADQHQGTVVAASHGPEGLVVIDATGLRVHARPGRELRGNPTGAGDAAVAAIVLGLLRSAAWEDIARSAVAASGAAVLEPVAGVVDPSRVAELAEQVTVTELPGPGPTPLVRQSSPEGRHP